MKKIIVAVDESKYAKKAIEKAEEIGKAFDSNIVIVNAVDITHHYSLEFETMIMVDFIEMEASKKRSEALLEISKESMKALGDKVETVMLQGDPSHELIAYINSSDADLVIIGSHGVKGLNRFMLGSLVSKVVHQVEKSVLIVR